MAKGKKPLIETTDPDKIVETDKEEGQIPFFIIDDEYGIAADNLCYMLVNAKKAGRTLSDGNVETYIKWEPVAYVNTIKRAIEEYSIVKERKLNRKLLKSKDLTEIKNNQDEVQRIVQKALSTSGKNKQVFETLDLLQAKEDVLKDINDLKEQKEKLLQLFDEFEALLKEKRKIIIKQTEPTKHRYKKEE